MSGDFHLRGRKTQRASLRRSVSIDGSVAGPSRGNSTIKRSNSSRRTLGSQVKVENPQKCDKKLKFSAEQELQLLQCIENKQYFDLNDLGRIRINNLKCQARVMLTRRSTSIGMSGTAAVDLDTLNSTLIPSCKRPVQLCGDTLVGCDFHQFVSPIQQQVNHLINTPADETAPANVCVNNNDIVDNTSGKFKNVEEDGDDPLRNKVRECLVAMDKLTTVRVKQFRQKQREKSNALLHMGAVEDLLKSSEQIIGSFEKLKIKDSIGLIDISNNLPAHAGKSVPGISCPHDMKKLVIDGVAATDKLAKSIVRYEQHFGDELVRSEADIGGKVENLDGFLEQFERLLNNEQKIDKHLDTQLAHRAHLKVLLASIENAEDTGNSVEEGAKASASFM